MVWELKTMDVDMKKTFIKTVNNLKIKFQKDRTEALHKGEVQEREQG